MSKPLWVSVAEGEIGVAQFPAGESNPRITAYHERTDIRGYDDKASWCSSFLNWCFAQAGIAGTGSALARSWLDWGRALDSPLPGCVVVLSRDDPASWKGHVALFLRQDGEQIFLLGGNQVQRVQVRLYPTSNVLGYRWPCEHEPDPPALGTDRP